MIIDIRNRIKASWTQMAPHCDTTNSPSQYISYRSKLSKGKSNITITQFTNGRLMLQGKSDYFLDNCCDNIEKIAQPSNKDVAARFVSTDQTALDVFVSRSTPDLILINDNYFSRSATIIIPVFPSQESCVLFYLHGSQLMPGRYHSLFPFAFLECSSL
jgi:hypothetical protein